jgi:hypothetical protein
VPRVAVLGPAPLLDLCAPASAPGVLEVVEPDSDELDAIVAFEPADADLESIGRIGVPALIWREEATAAPPPDHSVRLVVTGGEGAAWRCVALPVADGLFAEALPELPARAAWLGPPSPRRAQYLDWVDHEQPPAEDGTAALVAVNMHVGGRPAFEPEVPRALAAGRLLVSETLAPARGLEPGIDYVEARDLGDLFLAIESAVSEPHAYRRVQLRGRRKAELFRSSRVVARLVGDLLLEVDGPRSASS